MQCLLQNDIWQWLQVKVAEYESAVYSCISLCEKHLGLVQSWSPALWKIVLVLHIVVAQWTLLLRCFDLFFLQCNVLLVLHYCCSSVHWLLQGAMLYLFSTVVAQFIWRCNVDASGAVFWFLPGWPRLHLPPDSSQYSQCSGYCYL